MIPWEVLNFETHRKHREQRDQRLRSLEDELHRLYSLTSLAEEINGLEFENGVLRDIALRYSITLPETFELRSAPLAEVTIFGDHGDQQRLSVTIPSSAIQKVQDAECHTLDPNETTKTTPLENGTMKCPNLTQMGINFVLSLVCPHNLPTQKLTRTQPGTTMSLSHPGSRFRRAIRTRNVHAGNTASGCPSRTRR